MYVHVQARYSTYLEVQQKFGGSNSCPAVMFGHHKGDVQENVISNVMRVRAMKSVSMAP